MPLNGETVSSSTRQLWICPRCGARLVTGNLWHSYGRFTLKTFSAGPIRRAWLQESHDVGGVQRDRRRPDRSRA
jgi:hypothetical protein